MKYIIVSLLNGEIQEYHQKLVEEIAEKFSVNYLANQHAPTHFTLKDIFETEDMEQLERKLAEFARLYKPARITLEGYNRFQDNVIFMDIKFSEEAENLFQCLIQTLRSIEWMEWGPYDDENRKFHCSLAYFDIKEKYKDICAFLLENYSYSFEAYFDNITIFKMADTNWVLHKTYKLQHAVD